MRKGAFRPTVLLLAAACASPAPRRETYGTAPRDVSSCCRLVYQRDGAADGRWIAQTSVRTLLHPDTGATATIVSMFHTALPTYYRGLETHLRDADIVLAEGTGGQPPGKRLRDDQLPAEGLWVRRQGHVVARLLELEDQSDWEERVADARWVLADMATPPLVEEMGALELLTPEAKRRVERLEALLAGTATPEELKEARTGVERSVMDGIARGDDPGPERRLHLRREETMWRIAREHLASGRHTRAAFVYGAWHGPAIEARLVNELGFRLESACWHDAIVFAAHTGKP